MNNQHMHESSLFPLSFAQVRIWLLDQFESNNTAFYNLPIAARLEGPLDEGALQRALAALVNRHEPLRTTFTVVDSQPLQVIAPFAELTLPLVDLSRLAKDKRESETQRILREEALKPFNLSQDLMLRTKLIRLAPGEHILVTCMHHIASDGWSLGVFFRELAVLYEAFSTNSPPVLPELPIQYADYTLWQREWLQGPVLQKLSSYWKQQLASIPPLLEIPPDHPRPAIQTYRGARQSLNISKQTTDALRALSLREGCTLFMTLLAAFQTLIARYTGVHDITVGSPVANRTRTEIEGLIGCFINMIALRGDLSGDPTFLEALRRIRKMTIDAYAHQDMPFEQLVDELQPVRDQSYSPIFQILFILQNTVQSGGKMGQLKSTLSEIDNGTTKCDLTAYLWDTDQGLKGWFEYATDLYESATMERLVQHFESLLKAIIAKPDEHISALPFLSKAERQHLLVDLNQTQLAYPPSSSIHELIEARVRQSPESMAVVWNEHRLTYGELNARANRLAARLRQLGAGPEVLVALCLERSHEMVVSLLAIHKAGAAYVPLDPNYPKDRLAVILEDSKAALLLTQQSLLAELPQNKTQVVCLDQLDVSAESPENFAGGAQPGNLAYVIFTSGSTGRPKGVAIEHRGVIAFLEWLRTILTAEDLNGVLFSTSICFDISVIEVFGVLGLGGKIVVAENALSLPAMSAANEVVCINTVPSAIAELLRSNGIPRSVRTLCLGGEALKQALVEKLCELSHIHKIIDLYGPTETTVYSTFALRTAGGRATIGRPIANTQAYVLDAHLQPVPLGVPGELYLGGAGLARGYWNRPDLTAERFVANPFSSAPGSRLYRTGDLVRYYSNGTLEFIGRVDNQVKIRGFRIELGEIESVLRTFPGVSDVVVMARQENSGEKRLVAYLDSQSQPSPASAELRAHLKQKLPEYMTPSAFVILPVFPLTPNGKIDRKALPAPEPLKVEKNHVPPRDALDRQLTRIWEEIFNVRPIGICDNFFELGGHSLLAVRMFMQVKEITGKLLPLATLFQAPTIQDLAGILRQEGWEPPWLCLVPIKTRGSRPPFYCVHGVGGNILEYLDLAKYMEEDQPFYGIQALGLSGKHPWHMTVEEMAAHYVKEVREFQPEGPYYLGGSSFGGLVAFEMARLLQAENQEVRFLAFFDTHAPGYPKLLPATSILRSKFNHLKFRVSLHWSNFMATPGRERYAYLSAKIRKFSYGQYLMFRRARKRLQDRIEQIFWPQEILKTRKAGHQAHTTYLPGKYSGSATLFQASVQLAGTVYHPNLGWSEFINGNIKVIITPGHHGSIVRDPRARVLASQLKECLQSAQNAPQNPLQPPAIRENLPRKAQAPAAESV